MELKGVYRISAGSTAKENGPSPEVWTRISVKRQTALERMKACEDVTGLALELGISRGQLYRFQREALGRKPELRSEAWLKEKADERDRRRITEVERLVARQALELDFFRVFGGICGLLGASRAGLCPFEHTA